MKIYVMFDVNYLAYRALYSTGQLKYQGDHTGVLYGVVRDIETARRTFPTARMVFCFDHGKNKREEYDPDYKSTRKAKRAAASEEEQELYESLQRQLRILKTSLLGECGFSNVLFQDGYEADDMIAGVCQYMPEDARGVIYSGDSDLYQLLSDKVSVYRVKERQLYTAHQFEKDYGIKPHQWATVKAIGGCAGDDVAGVEGVGEKTAIKYLRGQLKKSSVKYKAIKKAAALIEYNKFLVQLPMPGVIPRKCRVVKDQFDDLKWERSLIKLGISSIGETSPPPLLKKVRA